MLAARQMPAFAVLSFVAAVVASFAFTQDWRPALAVGLFQAVLLRISLALHAGMRRPVSLEVSGGAYSAA